MNKNDTIAEAILNLPGFEDMTQVEIAKAIGASRQRVSEAIITNKIPHGKYRKGRAEYEAKVNRLVNEGFSDREIADLTNTKIGKVRYTRLDILGHPPKYYCALPKSVREVNAKVDRAIQWYKEHKSELKPQKGLVRKPEITIGDIIDVDIDDGKVDICSVKLVEVSGRHYIFQSRSGWTYTLTAVQLNELLMAQRPRKEWKR